jgi:hypothetical protein
MKGENMRYLDINNGRIEGWRAPMYNYEAVEFAAEIKNVCVTVQSRKGNADTQEYMYKDGTCFVLTYDADGDLSEIYAYNICGTNDTDTIYYLNK